MVATFNRNPSTTMISCYSPTNVSEETDLIVFYNKLSSFIRNIPKHSVLASVETWMLELIKMQTTNSAYTTRQTEMENI